MSVALTPPPSPEKLQNNYQINYDQMTPSMEITEDGKININYTRPKIAITRKDLVFDNSDTSAENDQIYANIIKRIALITQGIFAFGTFQLEFTETDSGKTTIKNPALYNTVARYINEELMHLGFIYQILSQYSKNKQPENSQSQSTAEALLKGCMLPTLASLKIMEQCRCYTADLEKNNEQQPENNKYVPTTI